MQVNCHCILNSFLFHLINTGATGSEDGKNIKEEKRDKASQPGGSSKENEEKKTTGGESDQLDGETETRDNTEPGILVDYLPLLVTCTSE